MAEFDPIRFVRCRRDFLRGPMGDLLQGGYRLEAKEWERWVRLRRKFQRTGDVIIYLKRGRTRQGRWTRGDRYCME